MDKKYFVASITWGSYRPWKVLKLKCWDLQSWKVLEKGIGPGKVMEFYSSGPENFTFWFNYCSLEKKFIVIHVCILSPQVLHLGLFSVMQTDLVCALFDLMQSCLWMECILESPWKHAFWVMENPGISSLQVLESSGKQCFNVCTNPNCSWSIVDNTEVL